MPQCNPKDGKDERARFIETEHADARALADKGGPDWPTAPSVGLCQALLSVDCAHEGAEKHAAHEHVEDVLCRGDPGGSVRTQERLCCNGGCQGGNECQRASPEGDGQGAIGSAMLRCWIRRRRLFALRAASRVYHLFTTLQFQRAAYVAQELGCLATHHIALPSPHGE